MERKYKFLLVFSLILPAVVCEVYDPGFALFSIPFVLLGGLLLGAFLFMVFKDFKFSIEKIVKTLFVLSVLLSSILTFIFISSNSAESFFKRHVNDELPKGIKFIEKEGIVSLAGGSQKLIFSLPADGFSKMKKSSGFQECTVEELLKLHSHLKPELKSYNLSPSHAFRKSYNRDQPNLSGSLLITNKEKNLVYLYYWKI